MPIAPLLLLCRSCVAMIQVAMANLDQLPSPTLAKVEAKAVRILITGATGALGGAIARQIAAPGVHLLLWGRSPERLSAIATGCRGAGADVTALQLDLTQVSAALAALRAEDDMAPIDTAMMVAGQGDSVAPDEIVECAEQVARLANVNFAAPAALAAELGRRMADRGRGRILLVGSAAGFHALPQAPAYAASKAGLARFAEALRIAVQPHGVQVTLVSPGFIDWADGGRPMPRGLMLPLEQAARRILVAFDNRATHAIIPRRFVLLRWFDRVLPAALRDRLLRSLKP